MDPKKFAIPALLTAIGIAIAIVFVSVMKTPGGKSPEEIKQTKPIEADTPEMLSTAQLQINRLEQNLQNAEANVQKIYNNQTELSQAISQINKELTNSAKIAKDQRAYIAMLYQKVLDLELKTESMGGGLTGNRPKSTFNTAPNPLYGTDSLPATPIIDPQAEVLPPLPESQ